MHFSLTLRSRNKLLASLAHLCLQPQVGHGCRRRSVFDSHLYNSLLTLAHADAQFGQRKPVFNQLGKSN